MKKIILLLLSTISITGCDSTKAYRAHGGTLTHQTQSGAVATVQQPENPKDAATQDLTVEDVQQMTIPAGAKVEQKNVTVEEGKPVTNTVVYTVPTNTIVLHTHKEQSVAKVGASQVDVVGETIAKLKSTKWWSVFGFIMFFGGIFCAVYPVVATFLGGPIPGVAIALAGLVIAVLPVLMVGHETLIIVGVAVACAVAAGIWYATHHGGVTAELAALKTKVEAEIKKL